MKLFHHNWAPQHLYGCRLGFTSSAPLSLYAYGREIVIVGGAQVGSDFYISFYGYGENGKRRDLYFAPLSDVIRFTYLISTQEDEFVSSTSHDDF